jgi:hypothetical protein
VRKRVERENQSPDRCRLAAGKLAIRCEDEKWGRLAAREGVGFQPAEVGHVLGNAGSRLGGRDGEDLLVWCPFEPAVVGSWTETTS